MPQHIVLLGDSIFDNKTYTGGEPDVVEHLRDILPSGWRASLVAVDGSTTWTLPPQLEAVQDDATHLVLSIGGNDLLGNRDLLEIPVESAAEALALLGDRVAAFEASYREAVDRVLALGRPTTVCTIYNGNLDAVTAPVARVALTTFNDVILRMAIERRLPVIDLRFICTEAEDYANPIEPSGTGGRKIAAAIARSCGALGTTAGASVYAG